MNLSSELISKFAIGLLKQKSFEELMFSLAHQVKNLLQLDETVLYSVVGEAELQVAAIGSMSLEQNLDLDPARFPFGQHVAGIVADSGQPQIVNNTQLDSPYSSVDSIQGAKASVPIVFAGNLIAVLDCDKHQVDGFSQSDIVNIETLTNIAAPRIANARDHHNEMPLQTQKVESLSIFVGGIAHDFNNNLQALTSSLTTARKFASDNIGQFLDVADQACKKSQGLIRQLMAFTKGAETQMQVTELETLVRDAASLALTTRNSSFEIDVQDQLDSVAVDRSQIEQVISNLLINADQSYRSGGKINIRLSNQTMPEDATLPAVQIQIQDYGCGIPKEKQDAIFQPYYSTKPTGSGLGLATSYFIVQRHHGEIQVESEVGAGTTFEVFLPTALDNISLAPTATAEIDSKSDNTKSMRILVVDDEPMVQQGIAAYLRSLGYLPVLAGTGREAIYTFNDAFNSNHPIAVVIIDLNIPDGDGAKVLKQLRQVDPAIPGIVTSGIGHSPVLSSPAEYGFSGVLPKPFNLKKLEEEVDRALASKPVD